MSNALENPTRAIARSTGIQFIGKIVILLLSLITIGLITRYLGVEGFGAYTTIFAYVSFLSVFADFGFFAVMITQLAAADSNHHVIVSNIMTLRALLAIGVYAIGFLVALVLPYPSALHLGIAIIAAAWFGQTLNQTLVGVFQVNQAMGRPVLADLIGRLVVLGAVFAAVRLDLTLWGVLISYLIGGMVTLALNLYFVRSFVQLTVAFDRAYWHKVMRLATPMGIVLVLGFIYFKVDTVILSLMKTQEDVGIYGVPYKLIEVLLTFPSIFMGTVLPLISRYLATGDPKINGAFDKAFNFLMFIGLPTLFIGLILARPLVATLGGEQFLNASTLTVVGYAITAPILLQILLVAVFLSFISHLTTYMVVAAGRQKDLVVPNLCFAVGNILLNVIFIPYFGYLASAIITVVTEFAVLIVSYTIVIKRIGRFVPSGSFFLKAMAITAIVGVIVYLIRDLSLPLTLAVTAIIYGGAGVLFGLIPRGMLANVVRLQRGNHATSP
ncbi:flippase [Candidatus Berkelbacteria bacterium]|nr:flippase [Candidatus Berkelbacteria bacterium]